MTKINLAFCSFILWVTVLSDFEDLQDSLAMLKIVALGKAAVEQGKSKPLRKAFADVRKEAKRERADG